MLVMNILKQMKSWRFTKLSNDKKATLRYIFIIIGMILILIGNIGGYISRNYELVPKSETISQEI